MYHLITNSDINILGTLNAIYPAFSFGRLDLYSASDKQGWQKTDNLPQCFGLLHNGKQIKKIPVFQFYPLTFAQNIK